MKQTETENERKKKKTTKSIEKYIVNGLSTIDLLLTHIQKRTQIKKKKKNTIDISILRKTSGKKSN